MDKENIMKKVSQIVTLISPLCAFTFKDYPYIVFLLPIISVFIEIILDIYFRKKDFKVLVTDLPSITITKNYNDNTDAYSTISWYINRKCKINKLLLNGFYKDTNYEAKQRYDIPMYKLDNDIATQLEYNGEIIFVNTITSSDKDLQIILYTKQIKTLQDFILNCSQEYQNYIKENNNGYYKLFTPKQDFSYRDESIWIPSPINVIKNRENVFLSDENSIIFDNITNFYKSKEFYNNKGIPHKKGILLYGLPGTGKSSIVYAIAYELQMNIYKLSLINITDNILTNLSKAIPPKSIILIEDIDTVKSMHDRELIQKQEQEQLLIDNKSNSNSLNLTSKSTINLETMLNILDGYSFLHESLIFFTTNHIEKLDPALIRCGRIDEKYKFGYASEKQIKQMLKFYDLDDLYCEISNKQITTAELSQICLSETNARLKFKK